ncbi:MAG: Uma2 family endonuclease [Anaerolineae bacterium]|nr:Uma2 family endonuclease [Anaerolineae bacterium]
MMTDPTGTMSEEMSFDEYVRRADWLEGVRTEWVAGKVVAYPMSTGRVHAELLGFLHVLFMFFMAKHRKGRIYLSDFPMYIDDSQPAREPDLMIVFEENLERVQPTYLRGAADLIVEIVSVESASRDRGDKFIEYERFGVPEYWLIDPIRREAHIYGLTADGVYRERRLDEAGWLNSGALAGFRVDPSVLWRDPLPFGGDILALIEAMG